MGKKCLLFLLILGYFNLQAIAQDKKNKYWIFLNDKNIENYDYKQHLSEQTIKNRTVLGLPLVQFTDIPLNQAYIKILNETGANTLWQSKWLNAVSAYITENQLEEIKKLPFVKQVCLMRGQATPFSSASKTAAPQEETTNEYGSALAQMEISAFASENLNGEGVVIGVIDAGYYGAMENSYLDHLFAERRILGMKDMLDPNAKDQYTHRRTSSDDHGTTVLQMITGYSKKGKQHGFATKAKFYLARTDHGDREFRGEEDYWITCMEWMDSLGVRIINTSLGYSNGFDDPKENYKPSQMDGKTSMISKATQIATDEKGLLVVVAAGNEGDDFYWEIVSAPADSKGALSVGAVDRNGLKVSYSSIGPQFLPYVKPNVSCIVQVLAGTSFAAPVIAGFAACLMQKKPNISNKELFNIIEQSATNYPYPNNYVGNGVPRASLALKIMNGDTKIAWKDKKEIKVKGTTYTIKKVRENEGKIIVFHKKTNTTVISQDYVNAKKGKYQITKKKNAQRSTLVYDGKVIELIWE